MDDQDTALNEQVEVETTPTTTPVEETETTTEDSTSEEESKKSASARVREAVNLANKAKAEAQSLREQLAEFTSQIGNQGFNPQIEPLKPLVNPGEEVTIEEINRRQAERDQRILQQISQTNLQTQQALAIERVNREARELTKKYAELDKNSDNFDPELSEAVTEAGLAYVRANPTKSLEDFVDKQMKLYKRAVAKEAKAEQAEVTRQQGQTAVRPTNAKPVERKFEDLSLAEMEAQLGMVEP